MSDKEVRFERFLRFNNITFNSEENKYEQHFNSNVTDEFKNLQIDDSFEDLYKDQSIPVRIDPAKSQPSLKFQDSLSYQTFPTYDIADMFYCENKGNLIECFKEFTFVWSCSKIVVLKDDKDWKYIETFRPRNFRATEYDEVEIYDSDAEDSDYDSDFDVRIIGQGNANPGVIEERNISSPESIVQFSPHTVHSIKVSKFRNRDILTVCVSPGTFVMYDITDFSEGNSTLKVMMELKVPALFRCSFSCYGDYFVVGGFYNFLLVYYQDENHIYYIKTDDIVGVIYSDVEITYATKNEVWVTVVTSAGEVQTFIFDNIESDVKVEESYLFEPNISYLRLNIVQGPELKNHRLKLRKIFTSTKLSTKGCTVTSVSTQCFRKVENISQLDSSYPLDTMKISKNGSILNIKNDHFNSQFSEYFKYQTIQLKTAASKVHNIETSTNEFEGINTLDDKIKQIKCDYLSLNKAECPQILKSKLLIITSATNIGIFTADSLLCIAETSVVFPALSNIRNNELNILSLVKIIPEISALIVVSKLGFMSVFRLVEYKGIYSLRQEFIYPLEDWHDKIGLDIIGVSIKKKPTETDGLIIYSCYFMDIDSKFIKFELKQDESDFLDLEFI